jgi:eukaryotic-like serine/threonine-protein kinase
MLRELQADDPQFIGPYRLRGLLSVGGMGRVFLGQSAEGQLVAVKVIRADLATDPEFRARFGREVTVARRVSSQFTATVVGADADGPVPWLATAYVAGRRWPMPWPNKGRCPPGRCAGWRPGWRKA